MVVGSQVIGTIVALWLVVVDGRVSIVSLMLFFVLYVWTTLSVTIGFHRHFAHRSFRTTRWVRQACSWSAAPWRIKARLSIGYRPIGDTINLAMFPAIRTRRTFTAAAFADGGWAFWHSMSVGCSRLISAMRHASFPIFSPIRMSSACSSATSCGRSLQMALPAVVGLLASGTAYGALEGFLWGGPVRLFVVSNVSLGRRLGQPLVGETPLRDPRSQREQLLGFAPGIRGGG